MGVEKAVEAARLLEELMHRASFGVSGRDARDCENMAVAAMKVRCYLQRAGYWGGPPPTQAEAQAAANRAWPRGVPQEVEAALQ